MRIGERRSLAMFAAMVKLGGSGTKKQVLDIVDDLQLYEIPEAERGLKHNRDEPKWRNVLAFERKRLVEVGLMTDLRRDDWGISPAGLNYGQSLSDRVLQSPYSDEFELNAARAFLLNAFGGMSDQAAMELGETRNEGALTEVWSTRYERDHRLRREAIEIHGTACIVCGFSFSEAYDAIGAGFIEVHHLRPISSYNGEVSVSARYDLTVLCSNCHRMIHRRRDRPFAVDELKRLLKQ